MTPMIIPVVSRRAPISRGINSARFEELGPGRWPSDDRIPMTEEGLSRNRDDGGSMRASAVMPSLRGDGHSLVRVFRGQAARSQIGNVLSRRAP
jgi:hypothetical protein